MPIAIASTLPKTQAATTADSTNASSNGNAAGSLDFASLLLGQAASIPAAVITAEISTSSEEMTADSPDANESQSDAAALLASLGLLPTERELKATPEPDTASALSGTTGAIEQGSSSETLLARLQNATSGRQTALQENTVAAETTSATGNSAPIADTNAAKFAVTTNIENNQELSADALTSADNVGNDVSAFPANAAASHHQPTSHTAAGKSALNIETPVSHTNWSNDFGQTIVWMANNDKQSAQLTLTPPQMGTVEISVSIDNNNATASFTSPNPEVREAIETALPRLREMFASAGIDLGQTNVSAESFRQQQENAKSGRPASQWTGDEAILAAEPSSLISSQTMRTQTGNGLVDLFA